MRMRLSFALGLIVLASVSNARVLLAAELPAYYAHSRVEDQYGVIAPWYQGINGQCDFRIRIAAETLKRYPWTTTNEAVAAYPHYVFSGSWGIDSNGVITPKNPGDWGNGDLGQRATSVFNGLVDYYRYSGDPAAIAHATFMADYLIDHAQTPATNAWPRLFISVPAKGKAYGDANPRGMIQLDICASAGRGLMRVYEMTGNARYLSTAKHWGDLLAAHCDFSPGDDPWPRYANPQDAPWGLQENGNKQTGGVTMILSFLDELLRLGYDGKRHAIARARAAGAAYLADRLLPQWHLNPTWGYYFWDWLCPVQDCVTTPDVATYLMAHPREFPNWRNDSRNILTLFLNRTSVSAASGGDVYSGAWAYPESMSCCGQSLWYSPLILAPAFAEWAEQSGSAWMRELACRQLVLQTYDARETGVTEDDIAGGVIVNGDWFNIAHPWPLRFLLDAMGWLPEEIGPSRENHIMRSSAVVRDVRYGAARIEYSTFDAPGNTVDLLRLAFIPTDVFAGKNVLKLRTDLNGNGYTLRPLPNGDCIVKVRHDGFKRIAIRGLDPQKETAFPQLKDRAAVAFPFFGNQIRLIGKTGRAGGRAEVYIDGQKQAAPIDCWTPTPRDRQVLYYHNGLQNGPHVLRVTATGSHNPYSTGDAVCIEAAQTSAETNVWGYPSGGGPSGIQRMILGYAGREDYRDYQGHLWRPATEVVTRLQPPADSVAACWWTQAANTPIAGTHDPELFRYGIHSGEFWVNVTVAPGTYRARLFFAAARGVATQSNQFDIFINDKMFRHNFDVASLAGGLNRAMSVEASDIAPAHGIIQLRLKAEKGGEAYLQALEISPANGNAATNGSSVK